MSEPRTQEEYIQEQRRQKQQQRQHQREQQLTNAAMNLDGGITRDHIERLVDTSKLQPNTVEHIENLFARDWPLSNLTEAQENDIRWKLEVIRYKIYGVHPPEHSVITGKLRAHLYDDEKEDLEPLSPRERNEIDALIEGLKARYTRGRGGFQQQQMNKQIAVSRTHREDEGNDSDGGRLRGLF